MVQSTQLPAPLQKSPVPQAVLMATLVNVGVPAEHVSVVHALLSFGTSVLAMVFIVPPAPLHSSRRQLPAVWSPGGRSVPDATFTVPQVLLLHVKL
jgi:hypothetical protein